ncbi:accessory gene regulator B family protein [Paenibacillus campi]|uniref:accessory gene regulator B family protein n=1 Tax=Paenibacillus campi TaxID=3106031 RepID=UPI002AFE3BE5|nr:accessory gene regulator B family protein [Paenibacillus sp. SGZ-1014]
MIDHLAQHIAVYVKSRSPAHPASIAVLRHALAIIINMIMVIVLTMAVTAAIGTFFKALIMMLVFVALRQITGGYHLKSGIWCVVASSALFILLSLCNPSPSMVTLLTTVSVFLVLLFAPSRIEKQSRIPKEYYLALKALGVCLVSSNFLIGSGTIALAMFAQAILLIGFNHIKEE